MPVIGHLVIGIYHKTYRTYNIKEEESMSDIKYEIVKSVGVLSTSAKGWTKEVNMVSWNGAEPKVDIRDWAPQHEKMGKGITLTKEEAKALAKVLGTEL